MRLKKALGAFGFIIYIFILILIIGGFFLTFINVDKPEQNIIDAKIKSESEFLFYNFLDTTIDYKDKKITMLDALNLYFQDEGYKKDMNLKKIIEKSSYEIFKDLYGEKVYWKIEYIQKNDIDIIGNAGAGISSKIIESRINIPDYKGLISLRLVVSK